MSNKVNNVTIGSDPEVFLVDLEGNPYPGCGLLGGTKDEPIMIGNEGHGIQEDNVLWEATIPPCKTAEEFVKALSFMKDYFERIIHVDHKDVFKLSYKSSYIFNPEHLKTQQALTQGCEPSYNVFTRSINEVGRDNPNCRSAGFHIHIGYDNPTLEVSEELVKAFNLFVVVPSVLIDDDTQRRFIYGQAGSFRLKSYGVEARSLGAYLWSTNELITWCFNQTMKAIEFVNSGKFINDTYGKRIVNAINNSDIKEARKICDEMGIETVKKETTTLCVV